MLRPCGTQPIPASAPRLVATAAMSRPARWMLPARRRALPGPALRGRALHGISGRKGGGKGARMAPLIC